ncbi:MAG: N-acetylmuramoyl-L-alanine amidase [Bacillota bacterium]|nr:N-acetylmuramoyl-L-alanine amidase [Bacillota bacterium]
MKTKREKRKKKGLRIWQKLVLLVCLFFLGYGGFMVYDMLTKPYTIALDAGHGGKDVGAEGIIQEIELTERTVAELQALLKEDGRFRIVLSRKAGEGMSITERNEKFRKRQPDLMLSIHGNASEESRAYGFEVYPVPPGRENHEESLDFALLLAEEMETVGAKLRGTDGVRFGYYKENGQKLLVDSVDTRIYEYPTFGMLNGMECPAVLVEQCFITNAADVEAFGTEAGCKKSAAAYYRAICRYVEELEQEAAAAEEA